MFISNDKGLEKIEHGGDLYKKWKMTIFGKNQFQYMEKNT